MAAALAIAAISAGYGIYNAEQQKSKAKKIRNSTTRPPYEIPSAVNDIVAKTAFNAGKYGIPGQAQIEAKLDESAAATRRSLKELGLSPFAMMGAYSASQKQTDNAVSNLGIKAAEYKDRAEGIHRNSLAMLAGEQGKQWNWNKQEPYLDDMATASAYENAGIRNEEAAVQGLLKSGSNYLLMEEMRSGGYGDSPLRYPGNNVDGNYRAPVAGGSIAPTGPTGAPAEIPVSQSPYRFNSSDIDMATLKSQMEASFGGPMTQAEFLQYARLAGYQF